MFHAEVVKILLLAQLGIRILPVVIAVLSFSLMLANMPLMPTSMPSRCAVVVVADAARQAAEIVRGQTVFDGSVGSIPYVSES